jgi:hypothetical protein
MLASPIGNFAGSTLAPLHVFTIEPAAAVFVFAFFVVVLLAGFLVVVLVVVLVVALVVVFVAAREATAPFPLSMRVASRSGAQIRRDDTCVFMSRILPGIFLKIVRVWTTGSKRG